MTRDRTRQPIAKARTLSRRTERRVRIAQKSAALFLAIAFPPAALPCAPAAR